MVNENYLYKSPTHIANLNDMRLSGKLCDVTIKVENKEFRAHKVILAANLKYFESMFVNSFQESKQDVIPMKDMDGSDLEAFVNFAYTGEMLLTKSNALGLLQVADYLNEEAIKKACIDFLEIYLDASDAFRAYKFANAIDGPSLKSAAKLRIQTSFGECSQTIEYLDLDFESLKDVMNEVKFDTVELHQLLFEGIMRWIMHDPKERRSHVDDLLCLIDVAKLAAGYLVDYLGSMADHSDDDYGVVKDMMSYHRRYSKIEQLKSPVTNSTNVLILLQNLDDKRFFQFYNFTEKKWSSLQEIPDDQGKINYNSAVLDNRIYYIGVNPASCSLEIFNPTARRATILHSSNMLACPAMCAWNNFVFLCGGYHVNYNLSTSNQVLRYESQTRCIEKLTSMKSRKYGAVAVIYQGYLHVLGGCTTYDSCELDLVEKYDFATNTWMAFPSLVVRRAWHAAAVLDGKLYVCGGKSPNTSSVEVYDPTINSWRLIASMNKERGRFLVVAHEGKLLAIGGDKEMTVEVYDPSRDQWQMDHEMSSGLQLQRPAGGLISASSIADAK